MRYLLLLVACVACGQEYALDYTVKSGTTNGATAVLNDANDAYGVVFMSPTATSVSSMTVYVAAVGTANVDSLRVEVREMMGTFPSATVTYTDASDVVNLSNNALSNGDTVRFVAVTSLPAGVSANTDYFVCNTTTSTFQIDDDAGCASIVTDFSGSSGTQYVSKLLASSTTFSTSPATAANWITFSSFSSHTLSAGRKYVAVLLNTEAVPGTDTITIGYLAPEIPTLGQWSQGGAASMIAATSVRGASSTPFQGASGYVTLASGFSFGTAAYSAEQSTNTRVNGTRRVGVRITTPANVRFNVWGIGTQIRTVVGNFPKSLTMELYSIGSTTDTLIDSCVSTAPQYSVTVTAWTCSFTSPVALSASTSYRVAATATSGAGDASNYISINGVLRRSGITFDNPLSIQQTYCAATCTTTANWTNETAKVSPFVILLDSATPYASQGSGGASGAYVVAQ